MRERAVALDLEVVELLAGEPELLAIADAVATTQAARPRRRRPPRLLTLAVALALAVAALVLLPERDGETPWLEQALAAVGAGPVVHARIEATLPQTSVVDLATGRATAQTVAIEYWFDEPRGRLRTVVRRGGVVLDEFLETRTGASSGGGPVRLAPGAEPVLDPALAGFVTRYRDALASGEARLVSEETLDGRPVVWLGVSSGGTRERVALDAETYAPVRIVPLDAEGRPGRFSWRVRAIESVARVEADFAAPEPRRPAPFRGDVAASRPVSSAQAAAELGWPALWLGESWRGLRLVSLERQTLTRGYPPGSGVAATRGAGLRVRYAVDGARTYVELAQAPAPEPAYAFAGGTATFDGNPIPREGSMELVELAGASGGAVTAVGQLRRDGVYATIWASSRALCLEAARALTRMEP